MTKIRDIELCDAAFGKMSRLRFLQFYCPYYQKGIFNHEKCKCHTHPWISEINVHLPKGLSYLPDELRYLYWYRYPLKSLPLNFWPGNLAQLHLICSHVQQLCNRDQVCFPIILSYISSCFAYSNPT